MIDLFNFKELDDFLLSFEGVKSSQPYGDNQTVYEFEGKMFALVDSQKKPIKVSLRCDRRLGSLLKEKYEEVIAGINLNPNLWITVLITGQLSKDDIKDLIRHSLEMIKQDSD